MGGVTALVVGLVLTAAGAARAQPQETTVTPPDASRSEGEARDLFEQGRLAFERGDYEIARACWVRAHELSDRTELLFNIGLAYERLQRDEEAIEAFEGYLAGVPDALNRREVESRIAQLRRAVTERALERQSGSSGSIWIWIAIGTAVVAGAVVAAILLSDPGVEGPLVGNTGTHTEALVVRW